MASVPAIPAPLPQIYIRFAWPSPIARFYLRFAWPSPVGSTGRHAGSVPSVRKAQRRGRERGFGVSFSGFRGRNRNRIGVPRNG